MVVLRVAAEPDPTSDPQLVEGLAWNSGKVTMRSALRQGSWDLL